MIIEKGLVDVEGKFYRIGEKVTHFHGEHAGEIGVITKVEILEPESEDDFLTYRFSVFLIEKEITAVSSPSDIKMVEEIVFG